MAGEWRPTDRDRPSSVIHRFTIDKIVPASLPQVVANYFDMEHLVIHSAIHNPKLTSSQPDEIEVQYTVGRWPARRTVRQTIRYNPPGDIIQVMSSPIGPVTAESKIAASDTDKAQCTICTRISLDLPIWAWPMRRMLEQIVRRANQKTLAEDLAILTRRQRLFGSGIDDYLAPAQPILFKDKLLATFAGNSGTGPDNAGISDKV